MREDLDRRAMAALSAGHFATDFAAGALPAFLPFFVERFDLSYTLTAVAMLAWATSSSLVQPFFGLWSDRHGGIWLLPGGVALAGVGMALAMQAPNYGVVLALVVLSGLGTAAYHPEGSKFAAYVSGRRRATGMAMFSIGGNLGYGIGPVAATAVLLGIGREGALLIALPPLAVAAALLVLAPYLAGFASRRHDLVGAAGANRPGALTLLLGVVACRSVAWFGLLTFVPLWYVARGHSEAFGNRVLATMLLCGGVGTLIAGPVADRVGLRSVVLVSSLGTTVAILVFVAVGGWPGVVALALVGVFVVGTFGVTMVMSQEYLPGRIGLASGLSIGLSIGLGGVGAVLLGAVADSVDLRSALYLCAVAAAGGLALAALLPRMRLRPGYEPQSVTL